MDKKIQDVKNELKILKNDLIQFFSDTNIDNINDEFYNKLIDYSSKNPEFLSILKLMTVLSSKNETELKQYKIKVYKILEKILNLKEKSLDILAIQQELFNEINKTLDELKNENNSSSFSISEFFKIVFKSKILTGIFGFIVLVIIITIIKELDSTLYNDVLEILKRIMTKF